MVFTLCRQPAGLAGGLRPKATALWQRSNVGRRVQLGEASSDRRLPREQPLQRVRVVASSTGAAAAPSGSDPSSAPPQPPRPETPTVQPVTLTAYHYLTFAVLLGGGLLFLALLLYFTSNTSGTSMEFQRAVGKVVKRLLKTVALRQVMGILAAMAFVRYALEPIIKNVRTLVRAQGTWEKSSEYYILRELYKPLEFLFLVSAFTTLAENFLPQLIHIPKSIVQTVVRSTLSLTFVIASARVVFNIKGRIVRESAWQLELKGDLTRQRRLEAIDKLLSVLTLLVTAIFGLQALGLDVNSVLAIGGVGGLAVGLAGREIVENLFTGLVILSSNPFEVGDEVMFRPASGQTVEGIVVDVGWYRTTIRSFEREIFNIPNSVFSRNVVLNITRKQREWRFYEFLGLRLEDLSRVNAVVSDVRKILRQDARIIQKLHRRVFLDKITRDECTVYISFYVEAANRDAFMAVKQDLLLAFVDCVERNGAKLARGRLQIEVLPSMSPLGGAIQIVDLPALPAPTDIKTGPVAGSSTGGGGGSSSGGSSSKDATGATSNIVPGSSGGSSCSGGGASSSSNGGSGSSGDPGGSAKPPAASGSSHAAAVRNPAQQAAAAVAAAAAAISSNPELASRIAATGTISADDILQTGQVGASVLASFDEAPGPVAG